MGFELRIGSHPSELWRGRDVNLEYNSEGSFQDVRVDIVSRQMFTCAACSYTSASARTGPQERRRLPGMGAVQSERARASEQVSREEAINARSGYMQIEHVTHALEFDLANRDNVVVCCTMCRGVFYVGYPDHAKRVRGELVLAGWITQAQLNNICRMCFTVLHNREDVLKTGQELRPFAVTGEKLYARIREQSVRQLEMEIGKAFNGNPQTFTAYMVSAPPEIRDRIAELAPDLRVLPDREAYKAEAVFMARHVFPNFEDTWPRVVV